MTCKSAGGHSTVIFGVYVSARKEGRFFTNSKYNKKENSVTKSIYIYNTKKKNKDKYLKHITIKLN